MRDLNKDFGAAVSEARRKLGLTQVGLAEELGKAHVIAPGGPRDFPWGPT